MKEVTELIYYNYHPVLLLPTSSKTLEQIMHGQLYNYNKSSKILQGCQAVV